MPIKINEATESSKGSKRRKQLILAMLQYPSLEKAAKSIGISTVTAWRIRNTPGFDKEFREARREVLVQALAQLQQAASAAAATLSELMLDANAPAAVRLRAADRILTHAIGVSALEFLDERLQRLESIEVENESIQKAIHPSREVRRCA